MVYLLCIIYTGGRELICLKCSFETSEDICPRCGTVLNEKLDYKQKIFLFIRKFSIDMKTAIKTEALLLFNKLTVFTKVVVCLWVLFMLINISSMLKEINFYQFSCLLILGILFFGAIAQVVGLLLVGVFKLQRRRSISCDIKSVPLLFLRKSTITTKVIVCLWLLFMIINISSLLRKFNLFEFLCLLLLGMLLLGTMTQTMSILFHRLFKFRRCRHVSYDNMDGHDFEYLCADILKRNGFSRVKVTQGSGDQGIDIIAYKNGLKYGIQCKRYSKNVGNKAVQEVYAGKTFYSCDVAAVITNQYFTKSALELAERNGVLLWDRNQLNKFIKHQK